MATDSGALLTAHSEVLPQPCLSALGRSAVSRLPSASQPPLTHRLPVRSGPSYSVGGGREVRQ